MFDAEKLCIVGIIKRVTVAVIPKAIKYVSAIITCHNMKKTTL